MKILKRLLAVVLCLVLLQAPVQLLSEPVTVQAAAKNGLVRSEVTGRYYYYEKGKRVLNSWRTIKGQKYYFGINGAACAAEEIDGVKNNIIVKKINNKYYGFNNKGYMAKGLNVTMDGKIYFFNTKTGVYAPTTTKKYRDAAKEKRLSKDIRKLLGKPKKTQKVNSCYDRGGVGYVLTYNRYTLELFRYNSNGREIVTGLWPS